MPNYLIYIFIKKTKQKKVLKFVSKYYWNTFLKDLNVTALDIFKSINQRFYKSLLKHMTLIGWLKFNSHLCPKTILNLIQQDQAVGFMRFRPLQEHRILQTFPGHWARNVISSFYKKMKKPKGLTLIFYSASPPIPCSCPDLTCRFGAGKDKGGRAAVPNLFIAGVHVDAVHSKGLQATDVSSSLLYLPL